MDIIIPFSEMIDIQTKSVAALIDTRFDLVQAMLGVIPSGIAAPCIGERFGIQGIAGL